MRPFFSRGSPGSDWCARGPRLSPSARRGRELRHGLATRLSESAGLAAGSFDAAAFLLSIQDIDPLEDALASAAWALRPGGRAVLLMLHPCFRIPRQSGWGWDEGRRLRFRRIDRYLGPLAVPMKGYAGGRAATRSYHRPLSAYVNGLAAHGLYVDRVREIPTHKQAAPGPHARAERLASEEIPLFLALRAVKPGRAFRRTGSNAE